MLEWLLAPIDAARGHEVGECVAIVAHVTDALFDGLAFNDSCGIYKSDRLQSRVGVHFDEFAHAHFLLVRQAEVMSPVVGFVRIRTRPE